MKLYTLTPVEHGELVAVESLENATRFRSLDGRPHATDWTPVEVEIRQTVTTEDGDQFDLRSVDCPWLGDHVLVTKDSAIPVLRSVLQSYGEFLPLTCDTAEVAVFNAGQVIDALDEERSGIERFDDGRLMFIEQYAFHPAPIPERAAFKTPEEPDGAILFTESLVGDLRRLELTGLDFTEIWDSDHA